MNYKKIEIVPYNPEWPQWFELVKTKFNEYLGPLALSIDHIGSTAVPGLGAKNRIDIQITLQDLTPKTKNSIDAALQASGLGETVFSEDHRPPLDIYSNEHWIKFFFSFLFEAPNCSFDTNIHFRVKGKANQIYALLFRDYLRSHPSTSAGYQKLKEKLAEYHPQTIQAYCDIKDSACDMIMSAAQEWANQVSWSPAA